MHTSQTRTCLKLSYEFSCVWPQRIENQEGCGKQGKCEENISGQDERRQEQ